MTCFFRNVAALIMSHFRLWQEAMGLGVYVLQVCIPHVDKMKTIHKIKMLMHHSFLCTGFILHFLEESSCGIYCSVPLCEELG